MKVLGRVSSAPEKHGVDVMFGTRLGTIGIQRKELSDFFSSVSDGRLAREYPLMRQLSIAILLIEGRQRWSTEGYLMSLDQHSRRQWTRAQFRSYMLSVQMRGVWVIETDDLADTVNVIENIHRWATKGSHNSLVARPKPQGAWGTPENRDWNVFLLQSFSGIGPTQAERLLDHFDGLPPIAWTCSRTELLAAPGIGKMRMETLWRSLPPNPHAPPEPEPKPKRKRKEPTS